MNESISGKSKLILTKLKEIENEMCSPVEKLKSEIETLSNELLERGKYVDNEESLNELQKSLEAHLDTLKFKFKQAELKVIQSDDTKHQWNIVNEVHAETKSLNGETTNLKLRVQKLTAICSQKENAQNEKLEKIKFLSESIIERTTSLKDEIKRVLDKHPGDENFRGQVFKLERQLKSRIGGMDLYYESLRQKIGRCNDNKENEELLRMFQIEKNKTFDIITALEDKVHEIVQSQSSSSTRIPNNNGVATNYNPAEQRDSLATNEPCKLKEKIEMHYDATKQSLNDLQHKIDLSKVNADDEDQKNKLLELGKFKVQIEKNLDSAFEIAKLKLEKAKEGDNDNKIEIFISFQKIITDIKKEISEIFTKIQNLITDYEQCLIDKKKKIVELHDVYKEVNLHAQKLKEKIKNTFGDDGKFIDKEDMIKDLNEITINLDNITEEYLSKYKEERVKVDTVDDVTQQCEILLKFKYLSNKMKRDIDEVNYKFEAIKKRYNISPEAALARKIRSNAIDSGLKLKSIDNHEIYKLPIQETHINWNDKLRRFELGETRIDKVHRHVMLTGMTGSGKSLLINNMINYIYGVSHNDKFRFKLIVEEEEINEREEGASYSLAESMTSWVTSFTFNWQEGFRIDYSLTIIDTPGFGDTRGMKYDEMIVGQIKKFFNNEKICPTQELTSIGLLIKASETRITDEQKYIFNQILNILGKDMKDNIFIIFTFADEHYPPALEVVKENKIPHAAGCTFKFNNSALYASNYEEKSLNAWMYGFDNFKLYFDKLLKLQHMSLKLTKDVLDEQEHLRNTLVKLKFEINEGMECLRMIECHSNIIINLQGAIRANKDHTVIKKTYKCTMQTVNHYITNCKQCNFTCHSPCQIAGDIKQTCAAMRNGFCVVCKGKCLYKEHINGNQVYIYTPVEIEETIEEMAKDYNVNVNDKNAKRNLLSGMLEKYKKQKQNVFDSIKEANECSNRLEKISLRPTFLSDVAFIERLIVSEECSSHPYKTERLNHYRALKDMAESLMDAKRNPTSLTTCVSDYEKRIYEIIKNIDDIGDDIKHLTFEKVTLLD